MKKSVRWTDEQLATYQKTRGGLVPAIPSTGKGNPTKPKTSPKTINLRNESSLESKVAEKPAKRITRRQKIIDSIRTAKISGSYKKNEFIEFRFDGALLLSANENLALTPWERIAYKKAWQETVLAAFIMITGGSRNFPPLDHFEIITHRDSVRQCDIDNRDGYLKAAIDSLHYANIIVDDDWKHAIDLKSTRGKGDPYFYIRIQSVPRPTDENNK